MRISKNNWSKLLVLPDRALLIFIVLVCLSGSAVLGYLTPKTISRLFDSYDEDVAFWKAFNMLGAIFLGEYVVRCLYRFCVGLYIRDLLQTVRVDCYDRWLLSYDALVEKVKVRKDRFPLGEVLSRIMNDTEAVRELLTTGSIAIFIDIFFIISCLVSFVELNTTSGLFLIVAEVAACLGLLWGSRAMARVFMQVRKTIANMARDVSDLTGGFHQTFFTPNYGFASKKSQFVFEDFLRKQLKANVFDASFYSLAESLYPILIVGLILIFPYSRITEIAVFAAILDLIQRSIGPIKDVASKISNIQRARTGLQRIAEFQATLADSPSSGNLSEESHSDFELGRFEASIERFKYPGSQSSFELSRVEFSAGLGDLVGIVGLSGSGKSTLLKILVGDILGESIKLKLSSTRGEQILLEGQDFSGLDRYRRFVSIVNQESHLFSESLQFNITMGQEGASEFSSFWSRCCQNISYLKEMGLAPEKKVNPSALSLGQKQVISALRACFLRRPLVVFDEISSALDADLEKALRQLVLLIQSHSLTIVVAHRIETIASADQIIVMHEGRIEDKGMHSELVGRSKLYQEFIQEIQSL